MLNFITGTSGSAKSQIVFQIIKKKLEEGKTKILLLIPEQTSFATEKVFLSSLGSNLGNKIQILSFTRLCELVFKKYGCTSDIQLDDTGRLIIMDEALRLSSQESDMLIYSKKRQNKELTALLLKVYDEFKSAQISVELINKSLSKIENETLRIKTSQIALIMSKYDQLLQNTYLDSSNNLDKLCKILTEKRFFKGYEIFVDSFNSFTKQELNILEQLLVECDNMHVSLCSEKAGYKKEDINKNSNYDLFSYSIKSIADLKKIAKNNNIQTKESFNLEKHPRFTNCELEHLEKNFFRKKIDVYTQKVKNIHLYKAGNIYDEIDYVARTICYLLAEGNYRYKDISVISRNLSEYSEIIRDIFSRYNIHYFSDAAERIAEKPIMNFILTAFDIIHKNFNTNEIMTLLKTGLTEFNEEEIAFLENYSFIWNISGSQWRKDFSMNPAGAVEKFSQQSKIQLDQINSLRQKLIFPLEKFASNILDAKNTTAHNISRAIYDLLLDFNVQNKLYLDINSNNNIKSTTDLVLAEERGRLWDIIIDILDQFVAILGNKNISSRRYRELLEVAINSQKIDFIPRYVDEVQLFALDKSVIDTSKVVFLIAANEGEFPKFLNDSSIFNEDDRKSLADVGLDLHNSSDDNIIKEKFNTYKAITSASDKLFVSWHNFSIEGQKKSESSIVREINVIFPQLNQISRSNVNPIYGIYNKKSAFYTLSKSFVNKSILPEQMAIYKFLSRDPEYESLLQAIVPSDNEPMKETLISKSIFLDKSISEDLFYSTNSNLSVSQVEKYYSCPFAYFCNYGLNLKELRQIQIDPLEYGKIMHYVFEKILSKKHKIEDLLKLNMEQKSSLIQNEIKKYVEMRMDKLENMSPRFIYILNKTAKTALKLLDHLLLEFSQSKFRPIATEFEIGKDIPAFEIDSHNNGDKIKIIGKIDRIDLMQKDQKKYFRIIDYKSGTKEFKWSDILYGLNLQLLVYLDALYKYSQNNEINAIPSAGLYFPLKNVTVSRDNMDEKNKKLRMDGIILNDKDIVLAMDSQGKGDFLPVQLKNDNLVQNDTLANISEMKQAFLAAEHSICNMVSELKNGNIKAMPLNYKNLYCDNCPYSTVCLREASDKCMSIEEYNKAKSLEIMANKGKDNNSK